MWRANKMTKEEYERKIEVSDIRFILYRELVELLAETRDKTLIYVEGLKLLILFKDVGALLDDEYEDIKNILFKLAIGERSKSDVDRIIGNILFLYDD